MGFFFLIWRTWAGEEVGFRGWAVAALGWDRISYWVVTLGFFPAVGSVS